MIDHTAILLAARNHALTLSVCTTGATTLAATTAGYTRSSGSFLTDGFAVGMEVTPSGFTTTSAAVITGLDATTMTVDTARVADVAAGGRTLAVALPSVRAWENRDIRENPPTIGRPWIEESYLPGGLARVTNGSFGLLEATPLYALTVRTALDVGSSALLTYVTALITHFAPDTPLTLASGDSLRVRGNPAPTSTPLVQGEGWVAAQVTIPLRLRTSNSR